MGPTLISQQLSSIKAPEMSSKQLEGLLNVYFQCHESYLFENWMMEEDLSAHSKMASSWDALP